MTQTFNSAGFISDLANELVSQFGHGSRATTPGLIGSSREAPVRTKLEKLLPPSIAVGSGCVIDSFGGTSSQLDIVLYEKNVCPSFCVNDDPGSTYYPCEGVIAVGEVKSTAGKKEIHDAFEKVQSVKQLQRYSIESEGLVGKSVPTRPYGSLTAIVGTPDQSYNQEKNIKDQIFGFMLTGNFSITPETVCKHVANQCGKIASRDALNIMVSLSDGVVCYLNNEKEAAAMKLSPNEASGVYFAENYTLASP